MQALTISNHGGLESEIELRRTIVPVRVELKRPDDVRIRVRAAALNHLDLFMVCRGLPGGHHASPALDPLGADACGIIDAVGNDVTSVAPGDYVVVNPGLSDRTCEYCLDRLASMPLCTKFGILGEHFPGTIAEYIVVPAANVRSIPSTISPEHAAAFTLATLTAWRMIVTRARVQAGENVLIWGIGGGVALAALQICKQLGAKVWVVSGSEDKLRRAGEMGADELLNRNDVDVAKVVRERTGRRGVDVVVDNVGLATWKQSLLALGRRGRLVTVRAGQSRPDRRDRRPPSLLEPVVDSRLDDGQRR